MTTKANEDLIRTQVREGYAAIAKKGIFTTVDDTGSSSCCSPQGGGCCGSNDLDVEKLVRSIGYSDEELTSTPDGANMGLSCGNPTVIASLKKGETVLDLGSGGGFDVFIAGPKVGETGRVIGVDMTPEMISKARKNTEYYIERTRLNNVEFRLGEIEYLPVADNSVDVVISNCVLNLSPNKPQVWREIVRVLKPGGRVAISDLALIKPLPAAVLTMIEALVGCVAGAVLISELEEMATRVGLNEITITPKPRYIEAMTQWEDPLYQKIIAALPADAKIGDFVTSVDIEARKKA